jgi:hypothetical protein
LAAIRSAAIEDHFHIRVAAERLDERFVTVRSVA